MNAIKRAVVFGAVLVQAAMIHSGLGAQTQAPPPDFAVRFEFGTCTTDVLDTFKNIFVRDMGPREPAVSIAMTLPPDVVQAIYDAVATARFVEFPSEFHVVSEWRTFPARHYRLIVRSAGVSHDVSWRDDHGASTEQGDRLHALLGRIRQLISSLPEVKQLPPSKAECL